VTRPVDRAPASLSGLRCDRNFCALHMSLPGPSRHFAAAQQFRRFRRGADIGAGLMSPRPKLNSSAPRSRRAPSNPSRDFEYEPFDQPSDDDYSKHFCKKNWHALETRIERFAQSCICLVLALLIFRLICRFPFCSILLRSQTLQCVILSSQSIITHAQLRRLQMTADQSANGRPPFDVGAMCDVVDLSLSPVAERARNSCARLD
jgi:hypothetical protein